MDKETHDLMRVWETDLRIICHAHYDAAVRIGHRNYQFGIPVIVLSATVGSAVFGTLQQNPAVWLRIIVGFLSLAAVVLASLQTFLKFSERAEKHREAGARFGALLKEMEQYLAIPPENPDDLRAWCVSFRGRWDELSLESPTVPGDLWTKHLAVEKQRHKDIQESGKKEAEQGDQAGHQ